MFLICAGNLYLILLYGGRTRGVAACLRSEFDKAIALAWVGVLLAGAWAVACRVLARAGGSARWFASAHGCPARSGKQSGPGGSICGEAWPCGAVRGVFRQAFLCVGATGNEDVRWRSGVGCGEVCHGSIEQCRGFEAVFAHASSRCPAGGCGGCSADVAAGIIVRFSCESGGGDVGVVGE